MSEAIIPSDFVGCYAVCVEGRKAFRGTVLRLAAEPGCVEMADPDAGTVTVPAAALAFEDEDDACEACRNALARILGECFGANEDETQDFVAGMGCHEVRDLFADGVRTSAAAEESFCYDLSAGFGVR